MMPCHIRTAEIKKGAINFVFGPEGSEYRTEYAGVIAKITDYFNQTGSHTSEIIKACQAANEIGIPILNIGPGGVMNDEQSVLESIEVTNVLAQKAKEYGVTLCCKAHVNSAIYNTPTTLRMMEGVTCDAFGVDMDPSHIHRAGENPGRQASPR